MARTEIDLTNSDSPFHNLKSIQGEAQIAMETNESTPEYPRLSFDIPAEKLISRKIGDHTVEPSDGERTRVVLRALVDAGASEYSYVAGHQAREKRLMRTKQFLASTTLVPFRTEYGIESRAVQRKRLVDRQRANAAVLTELAKIHDPVWQVLDYVNEQYGEQLSADKLTTLCNDVLSVTHWQELQAQYVAQVAVKRETVQPEV